MELLIKVMAKARRGEPRVRENHRECMKPRRTTANHAQIDGNKRRSLDTGGSR